MDHITKLVSPLDLTRIQHVPKVPSADWQDLPNKDGVGLELGGEFASVNRMKMHSMMEMDSQGHSFPGGSHTLGARCQRMYQVSGIP